MDFDVAACVEKRLLNSVHACTGFVLNVLREYGAFSFPMPYWPRSVKRSLGWDLQCEMACNVVDAGDIAFEEIAYDLQVSFRSSNF